MSNEDFYLVEWRLLGTTTWTSGPRLPANTTEHTIDSLAPATTYEIRVSAGNGGGSTAATIEATTSSPPPSPPSAPTGLRVTGATASSLTLVWDDASGETSYQVQWRPAGSSTWDSLTKNANITTATISDLQADSVYDLQVVAQNSAGDAASSTIQGITTPSGETPFTMSVGVATTSSLALSWSALNSASSHLLEWKPSGDATWASASLGGAVTSHTLAGLLPGTTYEIRVTAYGEGWERLSPIVLGTTRVLTPTGLQVTSTTTSSLTLAWDDV